MFLVFYVHTSAKDGSKTLMLTTKSQLHFKVQTTFRAVQTCLRTNRCMCVLRSGHYGGGSDVIARYDGYIAQQLHQKKRWRRSII